MRTIRGRLLAMLLTGLAVVLGAGGAGVYWIAENGQVRQFDTGLDSQVRTLASLVTYEEGELKFDSGDAAALLGDSFFEIHTVSGELLMRSASLGEAALPVHDMVEDEFRVRDVDLPGDVDGRAGWLAFRPAVEPGDEADEEDDEETFALLSPGEAPEVIVATVALRRDPVDRAMATLLGALIAVGGVVGITVVVLVMLGVRWGLVPVERLTRQLGGVSDPTKAKRFDDDRAPRELVPIYRELNCMLDRVELTMERERSFVDAAAHELRTPLAELRATAEIAIRWPDSERAAASLKEMLAIGLEMERLVESLLLISRGDASALEDAAETVPVAAIVLGYLERANGAIGDEIREKGLDLTVDLDDRNALSAPRNAGEIIIRNLIDNAVHYTPAAGSIAIMDGPPANGARSLIVENGPVDLDEEDLPRLFEPFWRTDRSRTDRDHVGLGLTVVHRIASAVGLRVDARLSGDRLQVRVTGERRATPES